MGHRDETGSEDGAQMRFLDEFEAEADVMARLGRGEGQAYDEGQGADGRPDDGLLEFTDDGIPAASEDEEEESEPVRIFVGRAAAASGIVEPDSESESATGPIAAVSIDDEYDDDDDDFDEFEDAAPVILRAPDNAPGMRLLTPEREESLDTDRAWPGLGPSSAPPSREPTRDRPSWLDSLPPVRPREDTPPSRPQSKPAWDAPLLEFGSESTHRPAWSLEDDEDALEAGDDEDVSLPVHEPLSFDEDLYAYSDPPDDPESEAHEDEADTGSWNRLAVMASAEVAEEEESRFGVAPAPVWRAEDPGADADSSDDIPWEEQASGAPWGVDKEWSPQGGGGAPVVDAGSDDGPALPPIQPMASVLQAELNARTPVEPKAVVLKTLDGVHQTAFGALDEPSELRSRVPGAAEPASDRGSGRSGRVEAETGTVAVEQDAGSGRLLLVVAITLVITLGAVWQWRSSLFSEEAAIPLASGPPAVTTEDGPELVTGSPSAPGGTGSAGSPTTTEDGAKPGANVPAPPVVDPADPSEPPDVSVDDATSRAAARKERRDALQSGVLFVRTDTAATIYVDGKKVGQAPMSPPGIKLPSGHHDVRVVPRSGRAYRTTTRVDAGRVRRIEVNFQ